MFAGRGTDAAGRREKARVEWVGDASPPGLLDAEQSDGGVHEEEEADGGAQRERDSEAEVFDRGLQFGVSREDRHYVLHRIFEALAGLWSTRTTVFGSSMALTYMSADRMAMNEIENVQYFCCRAASATLID
jgi:hypothetical protein